MKKLFTILLVSLLALSLFGCHGSKGLSEFEMPELFDETREYEITFWAKNDTNATQVAIYKKSISDFEQAYPNIKVNLRLYTDYKQIYNDVITNIPTNTTPNVCITYPDHIATYLTGSNVVCSLDELFDDEAYGLGGTEVKFDSVTKEEIVSEFLEECQFNGSYYAIPFMRSTEALYINKTYVEKLGYQIPEVVSWDWIWEVSETAIEKDEDGLFKVNGQNVMIPFIYKSTDNMMIQMLRQKGADYSTEEGDILIFNDTTKEILYEISSHAKTKAFSTFKISSYPANFLNAGQCIFAIDSTAGATWMGSDAPLLDIAADKVVEFETIVKEIPQYDIENPQMISQGPSICIFNKEDNQEVLASWLFAQYLLTNNVQIGYSQTEGYVPVTNKAQQSQEYVDYLSKEGIDNNEHYAIKIQASKLLINNTDNTFTTAVFNGSASLRDASGELIEDVVRSTVRKKTIDNEYMEKLYSNTISLYRLDSIGSSVGKSDLGPLPSTSIILLVSLVVIWIILGIFALMDYLKKKK